MSLLCVFVNIWIETNLLLFMRLLLFLLLLPNWSNKSKTECVFLTKQKKTHNESFVQFRILYLKQWIPTFEMTHSSAEYLPYIAIDKKKWKKTKIDCISPSKWLLVFERRNKRQLKCNQWSYEGKQNLSNVCVMASD